MTALVPRAMASICIDIFSPSPTTFHGENYDAMVVWVDRLSGWTGAIPTQKKGLTGEKTAQLMFEHGWSIFGLPQVICSDQDPLFVSKWWRTMCGRVGIRHAYSHAHRPQGNGRVDVAGKRLYNILFKLHCDQN